MFPITFVAMDLRPRMLVFPGFSVWTYVHVLIPWCTSKHKLHNENLGKSCMSGQCPLQQIRKVSIGISSVHIFLPVNPCSPSDNLPASSAVPDPYGRSLHGILQTHWLIEFLSTLCINWIYNGILFPSLNHAKCAAFIRLNTSSSAVGKSHVQ